MSADVQNRSPWRAARTLAAATGSTLTALLVHDLNGGSVPPGTALLLLLGSVAVAGTLTHQRVSTSQLLGLLVLCQAAVHLACAGQDMTVGGGQMLTAHLIATAATAIVLTRGEAWAWQLADAFAIRPWRRVIAVAIPVVHAAPHPPSTTRLQSRPRDRAAPVRGPPVGF